MYKVSLLDDNVLEFKEPKTVKEIATSIAISLGKKCVAGWVNGKLSVPSDTIIDKDVKLEIITDRHKIYKEICDYTSILLLATAIQKYDPNVSFGVIKNNEDGTTGVSFDIKNNIKKEELKLLEDDVNGMIKENLPIYKIDDSKIGKWLKDQFKTNEFRHDRYEIWKSAYVKSEIHQVRQFQFVPIKGVLPTTGLLHKIELISIAGEYVDGDAKQKMLQVINLITSNSESELEAIKTKLEEDRKKDHRYIGKQLEIFTIDPIIGPGLPIWLPNGTILKQQIKKFLMEKEWEYDFVQIETPVIGSKTLYETSGHWQHYREDMFAPMELPKEVAVLKPMSCPHHISVYKFKQRSYKELPLRFAEHALQHRYESSGSLTGLERVRAMELTDSHIFARTDQIKEEFKHCFNLISDVLKTFDIKIDYLSFSVRDPKNKDKFFNDDHMWENAENQLEDVLKDLNLTYKKMVGEAAFYGPKLDIQAKTALGHEITVSTIQLDFLLPQKFDLSYIDANGNQAKPVMIHRGLIGTYERFISVLLEQTMGVLPLWCAPIQVSILPVKPNENFGYCKKVKALLKNSYIRSEIDDRDERLSYKVREAQMRKIAYQLVLGDNEEKNNTVTYRKYGSEEQKTVKIEKFIAQLLKKIDAKDNV